VNVTLVPQDQVLDVWPRIAEYMRESAEYTNGRYDAEDILSLILDYSYPLWIAFEGHDIKGAVVTRFVQYPKKKYLSLDFVGGARGEGMGWKDPMLAVMRRWAKDNHCQGIESTGRLGWERIFRDDGYVPGLRNYELPLEGIG